MQPIKRSKIKKNCKNYFKLLLSRAYEGILRKNRANYKRMKKFFMNALIVLVSSAIGFVNGFFGGGGGMLLVPLLEKVMKCPVKKSHATAIAIILPISIAGAITYVINGFFDVGAVISVSGGCVVGGIVGALLLKKGNWVTQLVADDKLKS